MTFLTVSRQKTRLFLTCRAFLSRATSECLSKCPNSKKTPLAVKKPGYTPVILQSFNTSSFDSLCFVLEAARTVENEKRFKIESTTNQTIP